MKAEPPPDGYEGIVNRGPVVVFVWRIAEDWPIEFVSDNIRQWGYEPEDLLSGRVKGSDTVHPQDLPRLEAEVRRHLDEGVCEYRQEYRILTAAGEVRWVEDRNLVIRDPAGNPRYIQGIVLDITERKRLERAVAEASLQERGKIGKDLHDSLAQDLAALRFLCSALAERISGGARDTAALVKEIQSAADRAYTDVQKIARGMCPVELEDRGLEAALEGLAATTSLATGMSCGFRSQGWCSQCDDRLIASSLYRIAAEAVTNAQRHARASRIEIILREEGHQCVLEIRDDGRGFDLDAASPKGMGVLNMSYRASLIGGQLSIRRIDPTGTLVSCIFSPDQGPHLGSG